MSENLKGRWEGHKPLKVEHSKYPDEYYFQSPFHKLAYRLTNHMIV